MGESSTQARERSGDLFKAISSNRRTPPRQIEVMEDTRDDFNCEGGEQQQETIVLQFRVSKSLSSESSSDLKANSKPEDGDLSTRITDDSTLTNSPTQVAFSEVLKLKKSHSASDSINSTIERQTEGFSRSASEVQEETKLFLSRSVDNVLGDSKSHDFDSKIRDEEFGDMIDGFSIASSDGEEVSTVDFTVVYPSSVPWQQREQSQQLSDRQDEGRMCEFPVIERANSSIRQEGVSLRETWRDGLDSLSRTTKLGRRHSVHETNHAYHLDRSPQSWTDISTARLTASRDGKRRLSLASDNSHEEQLTQCQSLPIESHSVNQEFIENSQGRGHVLVTITTQKDCPTTKENEVGGSTFNSADSHTFGTEETTQNIDDNSAEYTDTIESTLTRKSCELTAQNSDNFLTPKEEAFSLSSPKFQEALVRFVAWMKGRDDVRATLDPQDGSRSSTPPETWWDTIISKDSNLLPAILSLAAEGTVESPPVGSEAESKAVDGSVLDSDMIEQSKEIMSKYLGLNDTEGKMKSLSNENDVYEGVADVLQKFLDLTAHLELSLMETRVVQEKVLTGNSLPYDKQKTTKTTNLIESTQCMGEQICFQTGNPKGESTLSTRLFESGQKTDRALDGGCSKEDLFEDLRIPSCVDIPHNVEKYQEMREPEEKTTDCNTRHTVFIGERATKNEAPMTHLASMQNQTTRGKTRKAFPRMRRSRDRDVIGQRRSPMIPVIPLGDMHPKKLEQQSRKKCQDQNSVRSKLRWFSVRDLRRSLQRKRKDDKEASARFVGIMSTSSKNGKTKKNVRFSDPLVEIYTYEPRSEDEDETSETMFSYYYGLVTSRERRGSFDEDEYSDELSMSADGTNHCYIGCVPDPPIAWHGFDPYDAEMIDEDSSYSHASLEGSI